MDLTGQWWKTVFLAIAALVIVFLVCRNLRKAITVAAGYGIYTLLSQAYDSILWPIVQGSFGAGGAIAMSGGAVGINFIVLSVYQRQKVDWLGVSVIDALISRTNLTANRFLSHPAWTRMFLYVPGRALQFFVWALKSSWLGFLVLSIVTDSFITTAFLRRSRFGPLEHRDILVFLASSTLSCVIWILWNAGVIAVFRGLWGTLS